MKPGDKVVCVDDSPCKICGCSMGLVANAVYVIGGIGIHENGLPVISPVGFLAACAGNHGRNSKNHADARRFRLLSEIKSELAALMGETKYEHA